MKLFRYLLLSLAVALIAAYTALWIALPDPLQSHAVTRPPLLIEQKGDDLLLWGSWDTVAGGKPYGVNAVEI